MAKVGNKVDCLKLKNDFRSSFDHDILMRADVVALFGSLGTVIDYKDPVQKEYFGRLFFKYSRDPIVDYEINPKSFGLAPSTRVYEFSDAFNILVEHYGSEHLAKVNVHEPNDLESLL